MALNIMDLLLSQKEVKFINISDPSPMGITLEYFIIINKIIDYYINYGSEIIKDKSENIDFNQSEFSKIRDSDFNFESNKEKSFFEKVSSFISLCNNELKILNINLEIENLEKYLELENKYIKDTNSLSYEIRINEFLKKHPKYKQAKDEFDSLENTKEKKIEYINDLSVELNKFRQYILDEFNPLILKFFDLVEEDEKKIKMQYIKILEKLNQKIDCNFELISLNNTIESKSLLKWDELQKNIEILENENQRLDKKIHKIIKNEFFINYKNENLEYFNSIKIKLNSFIEEKINKLPKIQKDIELENLKIELKSLELKFQELIEQKTEYLNNIEEFNTQYNLHLGELIRNILNLRKEILYKKTIKNQKLKEQYKSDKDIYEETTNNILELKNTLIELEKILETLEKNDENYHEIKNAYYEIKEEFEKLQDEFLIQEEELEKTKEQLKENEISEEKYEEAKSTYEEFDNEYEHMKYTQKDRIKLDEEQQKELKQLFKKAAKLCHPDIVVDELKEKAHEIMQSLNDSYSKKDIELVRKILISLENGITFKTVSSDIEDKELLKNKIKEFEENIYDLEKEIEQIKLDETFITISELDNWDEYFEELKSELTKQKNSLEKEAMEVLEDENKNLSEEKEIIVEENKTKDEVIESENSQYSKYIQSIENPNFEKIRRYCNNLLNDNQADEMQKYLAENGKMHKAIIYDALEQFISKLDKKTITLVDLGCEQGIGSMLVLDYIKEKQLDIVVNQIVLVDNKTAISRAISQIEPLKQNDIEIITVKSNDISEQEKLKDIKNNIILNLIVNDKFPVDYLDIDYELFKNSYFICVSNSNKNFVDKIYENISNFNSVENLSIRDTKIGRFEKYERIFRI